MKSFIEKYWAIALSIIFSICCFLFWTIEYPSHLLYSEQFQMFLFDNGYFMSKIALPGGLSEYIAEYLTQFYYYPAFGAFNITIILAAIQVIVWNIGKRMNASKLFYPISFLPSVTLWVFLMDENALLTFPVAILLSTAYILTYIYMKSRKVRLLFILLTSPILYWIAGPANIAFIGFAAIYELYSSFIKKEFFNGVFSLLGITIYGFVPSILLLGHLQYPSDRIMIGLSYYRFPDFFPIYIFMTEILIIVIAYIHILLPTIKKKRNVIALVEILVIALASYYYINKNYNTENEDIMNYDQMARNEQWQDIIKKAEEKAPTAPMSVTCLNLALGMTGQLGDRMFEFYQNGPEGLICKFKRHNSLILPTGEVFYHLGMINSAQRYTFEAMEAIPDYRKSVRCYKRLAQTNLINGQYKVAQRYLLALSKTLFYKEWAEKTLEQMKGNLNDDPEIARLRSFRYTEDFLYSEREVDTMLGLLFNHNYKNRMAFEYMMAYILENRDIKKFMDYFPMGQHANFQYIPKSYQEALVFAWTQSHKDFNGMPWQISSSVMSNIAGFAKIYFSGNRTDASLSYNYGNTYWYYLLCKK